jgi:uncharacterized protein YcfJ
MSSANPSSTQKSYVPILSLAAGMLICGVILASIGAMLGNELATCILAASGMMGGAVAGGYIGSRWHRGRTIWPAVNRQKKTDGGAEGNVA